jgi:hypothetical protein
MVIFMIARKPIRGFKMITHTIEKIFVLIQKGKRYNISRQYQYITYRFQWIPFKKFLVEREFQVKIGDILE